MASLAPSHSGTADLALLEAVERRVLWLATSIVHHANKVRQARSGVKVGGHQASSASMVAIMTALYFEHLGPADRVSVKPHAAPVAQAISVGLVGSLAPKRAPDVIRMLEAAPGTTEAEMLDYVLERFAEIEGASLDAVESSLRTV